MLFRNFTPFPPLQFESRDENRRDFGVVVLRGTFTIINGQPLRLLQEQEPIVMADVYHGEPGQSSLRMEGNLAPYKPKTDIHINATAHAPGAQPLVQWEVSAQIGQLKKPLLVTAQCYWQYMKGQGWQLTKPLPCTEIPLLYEHAYGGFWQEGEKHHICQENPVGVGYVNQAALDLTKLVPRPQIMSPEDPVIELGKIYQPEGFGPLASAWQPRVDYAGTFNAVWEKTRWPDLPEDFKFDFYNSAHPDLIYPGFVRGNEKVELVNLSPTSPLRFTLPEFILGLLVRWEDGQIAPIPMRLDTIHIEVPDMKGYLTWRGIFPIGKPIRVLEARIKVPASNISQATDKEINNGSE